MGIEAIVGNRTRPGTAQSSARWLESAGRQLKEKLRQKEGLLGFPPIRSSHLPPVLGPVLNALASEAAAPFHPEVRRIDVNDHAAFIFSLRFPGYTQYTACSEDGRAIRFGAERVARSDRNEAVAALQRQLSSAPAVERWVRYAGLDHGHPYMAFPPAWMVPVKEHKGCLGANANQVYGSHAWALLYRDPKTESVLIQGRGEDGWQYAIFDKHDKLVARFQHAGFGPG